MDAGRADIIAATAVICSIRLLPMPCHSKTFLALTPFFEVLYREVLLKYQPGFNSAEDGGIAWFRIRCSTSGTIYVDRKLHTCAQHEEPYPEITE
jgi:hypothetical protein